MTNKLVVIINSLEVRKIKKILLYEMKFLVPNYSCLQNPWLGGYRPHIPVLSVLSTQLNLLNPPPPKKNSWVRHWLETPVLQLIPGTSFFCVCVCRFLSQDACTYVFRTRAYTWGVALITLWFRLEAIIQAAPKHCHSISSTLKNETSSLWRTSSVRMFPWSLNFTTSWQPLH